MNESQINLREIDWEYLWSPYDESTYQTVLAEIRPDDIVLEIGAGDLRLAYRIAKIAHRVYAIELHADILEQGRKTVQGFNNFDKEAEKLITVCGDARLWPFPADITCAVLLMRHCTHFQLYAKKLKSIGCSRIITNARWRMGVEVINLFEPRERYQEVWSGWYACSCGATGFKLGLDEHMGDNYEQIHEVVDCPACCDCQI
jgi:SAM-dependent methyltransferase